MDVLLIDSDDNVLRVQCADAATADRVGGAAIYSSGGVSAYLVPPNAHDNVETIITRLLAGQDVGQILAMEPLDEEEEDADPDRTKDLGGEWL